MGEDYHDMNGNLTNLNSLVRLEPDWAVSRIRTLRSSLEQMTTLYENEGLVTNRLVRELEKVNTRLAECEQERDAVIGTSPIAPGILELCTENAKLLKVAQLVLDDRFTCDYKGKVRVSHGNHFAIEHSREQSDICPICAALAEEE